MDYFENIDATLVLNIEFVEKDINQAQLKLYKSFIIRIGEHFGSDYHEAESYVKRFYPNEDLPPEKWKTKQLDDFISKSVNFLADYGFNYDSK